jgi:hypothetical protein
LDNVLMITSKPMPFTSPILMPILSLSLIITGKF